MSTSPVDTAAPSCYRATAGGRLGQRGCLAYGQRRWPEISSYIGHQAHTVDLVRLHDGELQVCTFWVLPVRTGQAPQSQALSAAAGFGAFIGSGESG